MRVAGVFVGVSAQEESIRQLNYGHRDAERLHAIFADANLAADADPSLLHLLTNSAATCQAVRAALESAVAAVSKGDADLLVVHFSCHGTQRGQLVLYDTDLSRVDETTVALHEIADAVAPVPEAQVVITLDTCFSGTVLGQPGSLNRDAFERFMQPVRGEARFVVWASGADEEAYESSKLSHGYLSYALIDSIDTFRAAGQLTVPISEWLDTALRHARELAREAGRAQTPEGMVRIGQGQMLHVPPVGEYQVKTVQDLGIKPVDPQLTSLTAYGFSAGEIAAIQARLGPGAVLNTLQRDAIAPGGLLVGRSLMVRAPTSGGKTLVGELAMLRQRRLGHKTVVLLPTKALAQEQAQMLQQRYRVLGLRVIMSTGETVDDDDLLRRNQYDVALFTYEKFAALLAARADLLDAVGLVVFDEIQMIEDDHRGKTVELLLLRLRRYQRQTPWLQVVVLCAEVEDLGRFAEWLGLQPVGPGHRPVPLVEGVFTADGHLRVKPPHVPAHRPACVIEETAERRLRYTDDQRLHLAAALGAQLVQEGKQVLLFTTTRPRAITLAKWLAEDLQFPRVPSIADPLKGLPDSDRHRARDELIACAENGTAFHISDLEVEERLPVEDAFRQGHLRILVATTTLSMGINSMADAVIVVDTSFWQGSAGNRDLRLSEYRNMAGRAGRLLPGGPSQGHSFLIAHDDGNAQSLVGRYLTGIPMGLRSQMGDEPLEDLLIALMLMRGEAGVQQLADDIGSTYWGYIERGDDQWLPDIRRRLEGTIQRLIADGIAQYTKPPLLALTPLGRVCATFGVRAESVRRLVRGLNAIATAGEAIDHLALFAAVQGTVELDEVLIPPGKPQVTNWAPKDRGVLRKRPAAYAVLTDTSGVLPLSADEVVSNRLHRFGGVVAWLQGTPLRDLEEAYSAVGKRDPALGRLRGAAERTRDLLAPALAVARIVQPNLTAALPEEVKTLRARLEVGGDAATSHLYQLKVGLTRHECQELVRMGVTNHVELREAIAGRRDELEAALSTTRVQELAVRLEDARGRRRRQAQAGGDQLLLDLVGALTQL